MATQTVDINHPRQCLVLWRAAADELEPLIHARATAPESRAIFQTAINTLRQCADQLENRLYWSGLD